MCEEAIIIDETEILEEVEPGEIRTRTVRPDPRTSRMLPLPPFAQNRSRNVSF